MSLCLSAVDIARSFAAHQATCAPCKEAMASRRPGALCVLGRLFARDVVDHSLACAACPAGARAVLARAATRGLSA
ncbi:MAG TPA: hypothetical protein VGB42_06985 [Candidatus Thermoplasmatota archaeon]